MARNSRIYIQILQTRPQAALGVNHRPKIFHVHHAGYFPVIVKKMVADEKWYFTREQLEKTPTIKCGIDADEELSHRQRAAKFIQDLGQRLSVHPFFKRPATWKKKLSIRLFLTARTVR